MTLAEAAQRLRMAKLDCEQANMALREAEVALEHARATDAVARQDLNTALVLLRDAAMADGGPSYESYGSFGLTVGPCSDD